MPAGPYRLRFVLIDTDADVTDYSYERSRALGSFRSQLRLATAELKRHPFEPNEVRVLLLHHSLRHRGWTLQITDATRRELEQFLLAGHIQVMLCGHTHLTDLHVHQLSAANTNLDVLEACCGSTTQDTDPPYQVRRLFGIPLPASFPPNALITHEPHDLDGKTLVWTAQAHVLAAGTTTFGPAGQAVMHRIVSGP